MQEQRETIATSSPETLRAFMFGESESESPRVPSPWDVVLPSSVPLDRAHYHKEELLVPKLAAEVEEGNVEYKLHLINPSPTRFVHLVTQMKWRLLEGGGQAIYELGVADSGAPVGLSPSDLHATLKTLRAMATELGARVIIAKEIEVVGSEDTSVAAAGSSSPLHRQNGSKDNLRTAVKILSRIQTFPAESGSSPSAVAVGFGSPLHKQNGSKHNPRTAVKNLSRFQTFPAELGSSPRSYVSAASMTTSPVDSTSSSTTGSHSPIPLSSPPSPLSPTGSIESPLGDHETVHDDGPLFPMLALDEPHRLAQGLADGEELLLSPSQPGAITVPKSPMIKIQGGHTAPRLRDVPHNLEVESQFVHANGAHESDEPLLIALGKLEVADSSSVPQEGKRVIVEAMIIRELDQEERFLDLDLDLSSF